MLYRLLIPLLFLFSTCFAQARVALSVEESHVLREFFLTLTEESEAGYVLFNKKPVCIHGFYSKDPFRINGSSHKHSVALREGARIWNKFSEKRSDVIVHICNKEDPGIPGYIHVLIINCPLFRRVVNENLPLFQYILGPLVTSENLLNALLTNDQTYFSLLQGNKVLIGELLGFGTENSLYGSRIESLEEAMDEEIPPFLNSQMHLCSSSQEYLPLPSSFGFMSASQELNALEEKMSISSEKLIQENPNFIFGRLKDSNKNHSFIADLENTQVRIKKLIKSPLFLEKTLEKFTGKHYRPTKSQAFQFRFEKGEINRVIAKGIWESIQDYDFEYLPYFIKGFETPAPQQNKTDRLAWFPEYRREFLEGKENLEKANVLFQSFDQDTSLQCILPQKLYVKILKTGKSEIACTAPLVSLNYSIFSPLGHCLASQSEILNLKNTIPGFSQGIKGMQVGETREIFIHPSLAYGFNTFLEKCMHLRAIVTLEKIHESTDCFYPINSIDLSFLMDSKTQADRDENYKRALIKKGSEIAKHLKSCNEINLDSISEHLWRFYNSEETFATSQEEQDLINQVHWNIYFGRTEFS